jgi:hypothetical protein
VSALLAVVLAAQLAAETRVLAVAVEQDGPRVAVRVLASAPAAGVGVERAGDEVVLRMTARSDPELQVPVVLPPLQGLRLGREGQQFLVRIAVPPDVTHQIRREGTLISVLFERDAPESATSTESIETAELYRRIFPEAPAGLDPLGGLPGALPVEPEPGEATSGAAAADEPRDGIVLGSLTLRPSVAASYVDADAALLETAQPVRDRYYQVQPRVGGEMPLLTGELRVDYEARFRQAASFELVETTSHLTNVSFELPVGPRLVVRATEHFARGTLETTEVDPGREYFFGLARFSRNLADLGARFEMGARSALLAGVSHNLVRFDGRSSFFDFERRSARAGLGLDLTPALRAELLYVREDVPRPDERPEGELAADLGALNLIGELMPLVTAELSLGYRDERHPGATGAARRFRGLTAGGSLRKEFSRSSSVRLAASRSVELSAFERNAYYVATSGQAEIRVLLPYSVSLSGGAGYQRNRYPNAAEGVGAPRADELIGWSVGLGRALTSWAYVRADYRREHRDSNVAGLENETESLVLQLGVGYFGTRR